MNGEFSFKWSIKVMEAQLQMPPNMPSWAVVTFPPTRSVGPGSTARFLQPTLIMAYYYNMVIKSGTFFLVLRTIV